MCSIPPGQAIASPEDSLATWPSVISTCATATSTFKSYIARSSMVRLWGASVVNSLASSASELLPEKRSISALRISADSPLSNGRHVREVALVAASLCTLAALAVAWCFHHGYILYYGDAQSHLNLSRSILDSRTPGYDQLGTVWLP